jgi:hypothetical protein
MATQVVQMEYDVIQSVADGMMTAKDVVLAVAQAMHMILEGFKMSSFLCPPLIVYYTQWQELIKKKSKTLADKLEEMSNDLKLAIGDHKRGDVQGKAYFMKGISSV